MTELWRTAQRRMFQDVYTSLCEPLSENVRAHDWESRQVTCDANMRPNSTLCDIMLNIGGRRVSSETRLMSSKY